MGRTLTGLDPSKAINIGGTPTSEINMDLPIDAPRVNTSQGYFVNDQMLSTTYVVEGTRLYWTDARWNAKWDARTTDDLPEGSDNRYYTDGRVLNAIASASGVTITPYGPYFSAVGLDMKGTTIINVAGITTQTAYAGGMTVGNLGATGIVATGITVSGLTGTTATVTNIHATGITTSNLTALTGISTVTIVASGISTGGIGACGATFFNCTVGNGLVVENETAEVIHTGEIYTDGYWYGAQGQPGTTHLVEYIKAQVGSVSPSFWLRYTKDSGGGASTVHGQNSTGSFSILTSDVQSINTGEYDIELTVSAPSSATYPIFPIVSMINNNADMGPNHQLAMVKSGDTTYASGSMTINATVNVFNMSGDDEDLKNGNGFCLELNLKTV